jgi:hypothetical protein
LGQQVGNVFNQKDYPAAVSTVQGLLSSMALSGNVTWQQLQTPVCAFAMQIFSEAACAMSAQLQPSSLPDAVEILRMFQSTPCLAVNGSAVADVTSGKTIGALRADAVGCMIKLTSAVLLANQQQASKGNTANGRKVQVV